MKLIPLLLLLSGCATVTPYPYIEVGAGWKNDNVTSSVLRVDCTTVEVSDFGNRGTSSCGGRNPTAHINIGIEFDYIDAPWWKVDRIAYEHWSHYRDGSFNNNRETHKDEVVIYWKVGGRP